MPTVSVLGLGNWGTALANHLAMKGYDVVGWSIQAEVVSGINSSQKNPNFLSEITLDAKLRATGDLQEALNKDFIVLATPSAALGALIPKLKTRSSDIVVSAIKGLEFDTCLTPLQFAAAKLPQANPLAVLSGPSFAKEIVAKKPCGVVASSSDEQVSRKVAELFTSDWMKVYISTDPLGVELGGIVKNVVALAAGVCDGLGLGESARAGLITRGLAEMTRLSVALGAQQTTLFGLSGLGDLAMTSTSTISRNHTVGFRLGRGEKLEDIIKSLGSVAEGVTTTPHVLSLAKKHNIEMPISEAVAKVITHEFTPQEMLKHLMSRPTKREFTV